MNISIIIPTLNEEKYIANLLKSIKEQMQEGDEIIIVDSYSSDNTVKIAKEYTNRIFFIKRCGIGPAKTFGAEKSKNEIIAMLDADGIILKNWMQRVRIAFEKGANAVAGVDLYKAPNLIKSVLYNGFSICVFVSAILNYAVLKRPWMPVNNMAIKKDIFFRYGGLENVVCEDAHFAKKARGMKGLVYDSKMRVLLSDRRYKKEGFLKTLMLWAKNYRAINSDKIPDQATDYKVIR